MRNKAFILLIAILLGSSGCTLALAGGGAIVGVARQPSTTINDIPLEQTERDIDGVQRPQTKPMSTKKHALIGGAVGLVIDALAIIVFSTRGFDVDIPIFGCEGDPDC